jgi:phytoene dehydrogenase-like protein
MGGLAKEIAGEKILGAFKRSKDLASQEKGTVREWLLRYTDNKDLHDFFDMTTANMGMGRAYEFPAASFFYFMANVGGMADTGVVPQGTIQIYDELAKVINKNGDIWLGSPVKQILVKKGIAIGVVVQREGIEEIEISCKAVVSNVGPVMTSQLAGQGDYDGKYLADMRVKMRPVPVTFGALGSEKRLWPPEGKTSGHLTPLGMRRITAVMAITESCPEMAPPGHHLLYFVATPPSTLRPMNPDVEIAEIKADLEELFPDYGKYGKIIKIEPRNIDDPLPEGRTWQSPAFCMPYKTPVKNLYDVGDGVLSSGTIGSSGSAESAKKVVDLIKKTVKR